MKKSKGASPLPMQTKITMYKEPGSISQGGYPDTHDAIVKDQSSFAKDANRGKAKPGYRH